MLSIGSGFIMQRNLAALLALIHLMLPVLAWGEALPPEAPARIDWVVVLKSQRQLQLFKDGKIFKTYPIALGQRPLGAKLRRGDGRTPEGLYLIDGRNDSSAYTRSLHISYPNAEDRARAHARGLDPGDKIMLHGMPEAAGQRDPDHFFKDWTDGCIAVGNTAIMEIWNIVPDGTPIIIRP